MIITHLIEDEQYARKILPHIQPEFFENVGHQISCKLILDYFKKYNKRPTIDILKTELSSKSIPDKVFKQTESFLDEAEYKPQDFKWLCDKTEEYCKERALHNALIEAVEKSETKDKSAIPHILQKALSLSFDTDIGHDFFKDAEQRYDYFHNEASRIKFDIEMFNVITDGGLFKKTLNALMAGPGVGKSTALCHFAAAYMAMGYKVLYITLEMSAAKISKRIEANLFNINVNDIDRADKESYLHKISNVRSKTTGELKVKEYPPVSASAAHFRFLLEEMKSKQNFVPDVIIVDYLNICASYRQKSSVSMYERIKSIAEELRELAVEGDYLMWTATQVNRDGLKNGDMELTDVSESMGITHTLDIFWGMISTDELEKMKQIKFKQLKNRDGSLEPSAFTVGIDRPKMRLYDVENKHSPQSSAPTNTGDQKVNQKQKLADKMKQLTMQ